MVDEWVGLWDVVWAVLMDSYLELQKVDKWELSLAVRLAALKVGEMGA